MYVNKLGEEVLDAWLDSTEPYRVTGKGGPVDVVCVDLVATLRRADKAVVVAAVNKHARESQAVSFRLEGFAGRIRVTTLCGSSADDYNDIGSSATSRRLKTTRSFARLPTA
jgi:alpha-L-arabinofuranosidase